jgi:MFS family permease
MGGGVDGSLHRSSAADRGDVAPTLGRLADSWGRKPILCLCFAALIARGTTFALVTNPYAVVFVQALDGVSAAIMGVVLPLVIADLTRGTGKFNLALGIAGTAVGIGAALSTTLSGYAADHFGSSITFMRSHPSPLRAWPRFGCCSVKRDRAWNEPKASRQTRPQALPLRGQLAAQFSDVDQLLVGVKVIRGHAARRISALRIAFVSPRVRVRRYLATALMAPSLFSTTNPVTPSSTTSGTAPRSKAITGVPQAIASIMTRPKGSGQSSGASNAKLRQEH